MEAKRLRKNPIVKTLRVNRAHDLPLGSLKGDLSAPVGSSSMLSAMGAAVWRDSMWRRSSAPSRSRSCSTPQIALNASSDRDADPRWFLESRYGDGIRLFGDADAGRGGGFRSSRRAEDRWTAEGSRQRRRSGLSGRSEHIVAEARGGGRWSEQIVGQAGVEGDPLST